MASNGVEDAFAVGSVLQAMLTMRSGDNDKKKQAADYLAKFQKSVSDRLISRGMPNQCTMLTWP